MKTIQVLRKVFVMKKLASVFNVSLLFLLFHLTCCAPGLGTSIIVGELPVTKNASQNFQSILVRIGDINDERSNSSVVTIDGRSIETNSSLTGIVQEGLRKELKTRGANVSFFEGVIIQGQITKWTAEVFPAFPMSKLESTAELKLQILDKSGKPFYSGTYSGGTSYQHPFLGKEKIQQNLVSAMKLSIDQALNDENFARALEQVEGY